MKLQKYNFPDTGEKLLSKFEQKIQFQQKKKWERDIYILKCIHFVFKWIYFKKISFGIFHSDMESMVRSSSWNRWPWWRWISKHALRRSWPRFDTSDPFTRHRFRSESNSPGKLFLSSPLLFYFPLPRWSRLWTVQISSILWFHSVDEFWVLEKLFCMNFFFLFCTWIFCFVFTFFYMFVCRFYVELFSVICNKQKKPLSSQI